MNPAIMMNGRAVAAAAIVVALLVMSAVPAQAFLPSWSRRPTRWIKQNIMKEVWAKSQTLILEKTKGSSFQEFWNDTVANVQQNMDKTMSEVQKNMSFKKSEGNSKTSKENLAVETSPFQMDEEEVLQFRGRSTAGDDEMEEFGATMKENADESEWDTDVQQAREDFFGVSLDDMSDEVRSLRRSLIGFRILCPNSCL
jgi:hypothetical protein